MDDESISDGILNGDLSLGEQTVSKDEDTDALDDIFLEEEDTYEEDMIEHEEPSNNVQVSTSTFDEDELGEDELGDDILDDTDDELLVDDSEEFEEIQSEPVFSEAPTPKFNVQAKEMEEDTDDLFGDILIDGEDDIPDFEDMQEETVPVSSNTGKLLESVKSNAFGNSSYPNTGSAPQVNAFESHDNTKEKELALREKEMELRERELKLREQEIELEKQRLKQGQNVQSVQPTPVTIVNQMPAPSVAPNVSNKPKQPTQSKPNVQQKPVAPAVVEKPKQKEKPDYDHMTDDKLWKYMAYYMDICKVKVKPVAKSKLIAEFGASNVKRMAIRGYILAVGDGFTYG